MPLFEEDEIANLREALAVVETSAHLIRKHLGTASLNDAYTEKHFSRIEENVRRAVVALQPE
jgi:hypothetical protein